MAKYAKIEDGAVANVLTATPDVISKLGGVYVLAEDSVGKGDTYAGGKFSKKPEDVGNVPENNQVTVIDLLTLYSRFTNAELIAIHESTVSNVQVAATILFSSNRIDMTMPIVQTYLTVLKNEGILTPARIQEITNG